MKCLPGFSYCIINLIRPAKSLHKINPKYLTLLASGIPWSLSTVSQTNVKFLWIDIYHIPSIVSSLQVPTTNLLLPLVGLLQPILHGLESRCPSRLTPLQFRFSWLLPKSPCSIQLFRSTKVTPRFFATQLLSVVYSSDALPSHISALQNATQNKWTVQKFRFCCSHKRVHFTHHTVQISWS